MMHRLIMKAMLVGLSWVVVITALTGIWVWLGTRSERKKAKIPEVPSNNEESGMATIRASCPACGDVELTNYDMVVRRCLDNGSESYAFLCPSCRKAVNKLADPKIIDLLLSSGVRLSEWHRPAELGEPHVGDPITYDDLLEFHYEVQSPHWLDRLVAGS